MYAQIDQVREGARRLDRSIALIKDVKISDAYTRLLH